MNYSFAASVFYYLISMGWLLAYGLHPTTDRAVLAMGFLIAACIKETLL